jgi:3-dehydroquinate synthase
VLYHKSFLRLQIPYPIFIGAGIYADVDLLAPYIAGQQILIVTQENISKHYLQRVQLALSEYQCDVHLLPDGEQHKTLAQWQTIIDKLVACRHERSTTLIALGGGMVGDMTGFAAACYQRGVHYLQMPTTLIGQVDAAIGGKTAVNLPQGKNLLGAFYQPRCVIIDIELLATLQRRDYVAGLAEVIKYALIWDKNFFVWLENNFQKLLDRDPAALLHAIQISTAIKAAIVSQDEKENGLRSLLNFGHTVGHALEAALGFQKILHGEAVAVGMWIASQLSVRSHFLAEKDLPRILNLLNQMGMSAYAFDFPSASELMQFMSHDKKIAAGNINFILLKEIGVAEKTCVLSAAQIQHFLTAIKKGEHCSPLITN